ncbi:MAG: hypothetical protein J6P29_06000 [Acetobacter sp.]|nr:hypothetical protein [Acetobacter sp.]
MKVKLFGPDRALLTPTGGMIKDKLTNRLYSEVSVKQTAIWRFTDADTVTYEVVNLDTVPDDVKAIFKQVLDLIMKLVTQYGATDALRSLEQINIASLFGLAEQFHVDPADMQQLIMQVVMLKTDIEARMPRSWYDLWNGNLKPYLVEAFKTGTTA